MPILAVDMPPEIILEVMNLVKAGAYASPEQFLELAARNQLVYERAGSRFPNSADDRARRRRSDTTSGSASGSTDALDFTPWSALFQLRTNGSLPTPAPAGKGDQRIWGQINRVLPIKLATRFLHVRATAQNTWPKIKELYQPLADAVAHLGTVLEQLDRQGGRQRDALLSTGLPRLGNEPSAARFITQFVARLTREGKIYPGAVCQYPLAAVDKDQRIILTELGITFATLPNPLLDGAIDEATATLSDEERRFFLEEVVPRVPSEHVDMKAGLVAVHRGADSPQALAADLVQAVHRDPRTQGWSDIMMRTHLSGVVSRMVDLTLLRRRWEGRRVSYELGPLACQFVDGDFVKIP